MKKFASLAIGLGVFFSSLPALSSEPLHPVDPERQVSCCKLDLLGWDAQIWVGDSGTGDRDALLQAIADSLRYLDTEQAVEDYQNYPVAGITRDRVRRSLERFRELVISTQSAVELQTAVRREFVWYQASGYDGQGTVAFTGYFEPTYSASRQPTEEYRYPLYALPSDFESWSLPHPTRRELEGVDGTGANSPLRGLELVWLRDRLEAFLVQVQGSARLQLTDGNVITVNYAGNTDYTYVGIGAELVRDGKMALEELTLQALQEYFQQHPSQLSDYLLRNNRFIFFRTTNGDPAMGFLKVPVTAERSIATDKSLMPPGALALIHTQIPTQNQNGSDLGEWEQPWVSRFVLDHDTGGAIKGPGRVDIFMGTGQVAGDRAGLINSTGQLYYLLLPN